MKKNVNKLLLAGDKFTPELHQRQLGFTYSTCGSFTKHRERIKSFKETALKLDKACFGHDAAYSDSKNLAKRTIS